MSSPRANLILAVLLLGVIALLPRPVLPLVTSLHGPITFLLAPVQEPVRSVLVWLHGTPPESRNPLAAQLQSQLDEARLELRQAKQETDDLRGIIRDLSRGMELNAGLAVRQLTAPVIGFGADLTGGLLTVRAGRQEKVNKNDVVAVRGVYLMGRVVRVEDRTCAVMPITQKGFGKFDGVIMLDDQRLGPECQLEPAGDGTLTGKVKYSGEISSAAELPTVLPDMLVRLSDKEWPPSARMLVIGRITRVEPSPNQLQRLIVTVEPIQNLARTSEVIIRIPEDAPPIPTPTTTTEKGAKSKP